VDQLKEDGPKPIDPKIAGKHRGLSRPVWIEIAKRQKNREEAQKYQKELVDKADFSEAFSK
jgi:hypothetical protein